MKTMLIWEKLQSITQYIFQARDFPLSSSPPPPPSQLHGQINNIKERYM